MHRSLFSSIAVAVMMLLPPGASAQDQFTVTTCPGGEKVPIPFEIDCSHLKDPQSKAHCEPFIINQACKLYPAYRKITNVVLEKWCKNVKYTIYEPDNWPKQDAEAGAGGMTRSCSVDYKAKYSVDSYFRIAGTPYDTHEILHVYQMGIGGIGSLQYIHSLFGPSQVEAMKLIGDATSFKKWTTILQEEVNAFETTYQKQQSKPATDRCILAQGHIEASLYLEDNNNVYEMWRKLGPPHPKPTVADRLARFNRMYDAVSGSKERQFLLAHGCPPY